MFVGRINKETPDVSRFTVDLSEWLDDGEVATSILTHTITLGTTGWSNTPFPVPGAAPPYDPTPLLYTEVKLVDGGTGVEVYVSFGTPGNVYTCQFEIIGTTLREVTFEVGVQISGQPPAAVPVVTQPIPLDALSIYGGQMLGPLYLFEDPTYPTEAVTKQYADWVAAKVEWDVSTKVNRAGDNMAGFLTLFADPVQPLQAATKNYVDVQTGSTLHDAPNDGVYYGRRNLAWTRVVEEAPLNTFGYLRSNGAWTRGVPEVTTASIDVRVTDGGGSNIPTLSGTQTPFSAGTDFFDVAARRFSTGALGDGGLVRLSGPTFPSAPNAVEIYTGTRAATKGWVFDQTGALTAPGPIYATGIIRSSTGRIMSLTADGSVPSVVGYDVGHGYASGFWVGSAGAIGFGACDGSGAPYSGWVTMSSSGISCATLSTSANVAIGTSLYVATSITANTLNANGISSNGDISAAGNLYAGANIGTANGVYGGYVSSSGNVNANADLTVQRNASVAGTVSVGYDVSAGRNVVAGSTVYAINGDMVFGVGANGRITQYTGNYYWDFFGSGGKLAWTVAGNALWVMDFNNSRFCYNWLGSVGGQGPFINMLSSADKKTDMVAATQGLAQVLGLIPKTFRVKERPERLELGFVIEDVREVIPEAVVELHIDGPDSLSYGIIDTPILAAAVNAIKELNARIAILEARSLRE